MARWGAPSVAAWEGDGDGDGGRWRAGRRGGSLGALIGGRAGELPFSASRSTAVVEVVEVVVEALDKARMRSAAQRD